MADGRESSEDTNVLLEVFSALSSAFSVVDVPRVTPNLTPTTTSEEPAAESFAASAERAGEEQWKKDYDTYVERWKAESAVAREKAERTRGEWEAKRLAEREGGGGGSDALSEEEDFPPLVGPPNPHFPRTGYSVSPSPADARDSVSGESSSRQKSSFASVVAEEENSPPASQALEQSSRWEEVSSMHSSSLSFPEPSQSASSPDLPSKSERLPEKTNASERVEKIAPPARSKIESPPSVSLSVFDPRLSNRSRAVALLTSFAINLALPFVNGVMLGFGEIFARSLLTKWGWSVPGGAATAVGIGASKSRRR